MKKTWKVILLVVSICAALGALIYKGLEMFSNWYALSKVKASRSGWEDGFKIGTIHGENNAYWKLYLSNDISWNRYQELTKEKE